MHQKKNAIKHLHGNNFHNFIVIFQEEHIFIDKKNIKFCLALVLEFPCTKKRNKCIILTKIYPGHTIFQL